MIFKSLIYNTTPYMGGVKLGFYPRGNGCKHNKDLSFKFGIRSLNDRSFFV